MSMSGKRPNQSPSDGSGKKRNSIHIKQKIQIINQHEGGKAIAAIACDEHLPTSTVYSIIREKEKIMDTAKAFASAPSSIPTNKGTGPLEDMEQLLVTWMEDQVLKQRPLLTIQTKIYLLFEELKKKYDDADNKDFVASHGWSECFKNHHHFHSGQMGGEAASADVKAATRFKDALHKIVVDQGYLPEQIFNVDETGLYWKRMPERSYIHKEATAMPGFRAYKDRLTLLLGGNVAGYKLKPFMIYHSANPKALARISKHTLPVHYRHHKKARMTALLFEDWLVHCFIPEAKDYCRDNNIPFKILLILDNAPSHPQHTGDINENVNVVFLPPNTTSLIQPMDQGAVTTFKAHYLQNTFGQAVQALNNEEKELRTFWKEFNVLNAIMNIGRAWQEVKKECMNGIWKNVLRVYVNTYKGFHKDEEVMQINKKIVALGRSLELKLEEQDIQDLIDVQDEELTEEDLIALAEEEEEIEGELEQKFTTETMAEAFASIEQGMKLFGQMDVNFERFAKVERGLQGALACYRVIYEEREKRTVQATMDVFLKKTTPVPSHSPTPSPTPSSTPEPRPSTSRDISIFEIPAVTADLTAEGLQAEEELIDLVALSSSSSANF